MAKLFVGYRLIASSYTGGVIGGLGYRYSSPQLSLLLTAIGKLLAAIGFLLAKPAQEKQLPPHEGPAQKALEKQ